MRRSFSVIGPFLILSYGLVRNALVAKFLLATVIVFLFLFLLAAAWNWVWEGYSPAARRLRRGRERIVGPEGRSRLPFASPPARERVTLGPAFQPLSTSRPRGARRGARR